MKKLNDIPRAWGNDPDDPWEKDRLIEALERAGHKTISVGRAVLTIEQAEPGDPVPAGWSHDPLKITVYPDPDAGFGPEPTELHVHAHRAGLMEVFLRAGARTLRMVPLESELVARTRSLSIVAAAAAIAELARGTLAGYYHKKNVEPWNGHPPGSVLSTEFDPKLGELARGIHAAIDAYVARVRELSPADEELDDDGGEE